jgi:hypothetical protein
MKKRLRRGLSFALIAACLVFSTAALAQVGDFQMAPTDENTYLVTYDLSNLECVSDVGTAYQCAVTNQAADEGGYPWTKVKCRRGDISVNTFAWSHDNNRPLIIFEAPPALASSPNTYKVNVRLSRVCMMSGSSGNAK